MPVNRYHVLGCEPEARRRPRRVPGNTAPTKTLTPTTVEYNTESLLARAEGALCEAGQLLCSRGWFEAAYRVAEQDGDSVAMARAAVGLGGLWVHEHRMVVYAVSVAACQRHALSLVGPGSALGLRLRVRLAAEADYRHGTHASILAIVDEARAAGDPVAVAEALSLAHHCVLGPDHAELRRQLADELVAVSVRTGRRVDQLMGLLWLVVDLYLAADRHAERYLRQLRDLLAQQDHLAVRFIVEAIDVMLCIRSGAFDAAEAQAALCRNLGDAAGDVNASAWYGGQLVALRWYQGRLPELLPLLVDMVSSPALSAVDYSYVAALAVAAATVGDHHTAVGALARLCGEDLANLPRSSSWLVTMYGVVEAAHLLRDVELSTRAYELLSPHAGIPMVAGLGAVCFGSTHHTLGVASLTVGEVDRAIEHLRAAVTGNLALGHRPAATLSRIRLSDALLLRGAVHDAIAAERELATAVQEAAASGMPAPQPVRDDAANRVVCRRLGQQWQLIWGHRHAVVRDCVGMRHISVLLANPGQEIAAINLATRSEQPALASTASANGTAQPILDQVARRQYQQRLSDLEAEIDEFDANNDLEHAARARIEREWLLAELAYATGLAGRSRQFPDNDERARIAVGKAIRRALNRLAEAEPAIGDELRATIRTGRQCAYEPRRVRRRNSY
jgi:hypothetical protein